MSACPICHLDCGERLFAHGPENCRDELAREVARLQAVVKLVEPLFSGTCDADGCKELSFAGVMHANCEAHAGDDPIMCALNDQTIAKAVMAALRGGPKRGGRSEP